MCFLLCVFVVFFFKQKTAYEMRISDWSSDVCSSDLVVSLGHANPVIADAIAGQARTLCHVSNLFGTEPGWEVARTLDELLRHGNTDASRYQTFFCNSGAESNEAAINLARKFGARGHNDGACAFSSSNRRTTATP